MFVNYSKFSNERLKNSNHKYAVKVEERWCIERRVMVSENRIIHSK